MAFLPFVQTGAALALCVFLLVPSQAQALSSAEIQCRDTIAKGMAKYVKTAFGVVRSCQKARSSGGVDADTDCNDPVTGDTSGKLAQRAAQVDAQINSACSGASSLLSEYPSCPAPAESADDGGATTGIDDMGEVADCEIALANARVEIVADAAGNPDADASDSTVKCHQATVNAAGKLVGAYMKERRKCQRSADASLENPDYICDAYDPNNKIAGARAKTMDAVGRSCLMPSERFDEMNGCGGDTNEQKECVVAAADAQGSTSIRQAYLLPDDGSATTTTTIAPTTTTIADTTTTIAPTTTTLIVTTTTMAVQCGDTFPTCGGECPSGEFCQVDGLACACVEPSGACADATVIRTFNAKNGTPPSESQLSTGWTGTAHDLDIPDNIVDHVNVSCDENCENCGVDLKIRDEATSNCRCASSPQTTCGVINGPDTEACGTVSPTCNCYFGSPLAISSGGTPVCVVNRIRNDYGGTVDLQTGQWHETTELISLVHIGTNVINPCPMCLNDVTQNDGVRDGTCSGGLQNGTSCDVNGNHRTYGPTSFDCPPAPGSNVSGSGLLINLQFSTDAQELSATLPCDSPVGAMCPCRVCSDNGQLGCSSDAQCAAAGAGTCTAGGGAGVNQNECTDFLCASNAQCEIGPIDKYCDGVTHPDGRGFLSCVTDVDCQALNAGNCTIFDLRRCFPDPITTAGVADIEKPLKGAIFCIPPTTSPAVNSSGGLPGPGTFEIDFNVDLRCQSDPNVVYELPNGANCPGFGTTTTESPTTTTPTTTLPLPACEDALSPVCAGACPVGSVCLDALGSCSCAPL
ncbi:MAG TPA: hypothetical protein VEL28_05500 [Candidatus Binatia bacterium]|nr:hypothetical protein [Candidatus Binatia bacterium]